MPVTVAIFTTLASLLNIYALVIFARIILTYFRPNPGNPLVRLLTALVDPVLAPLRRVLPSFGGLDFSPVLAIVLVYELASICDQLAVGVTTNPVAVVVSVVLSVVSAILLIVLLLVFVRVIISFLHADPWHPLVFTTRALTDRFVAPFRRVDSRLVGAGEGPAVAALVVLLLVFVLVTQLLFPLIQQGANAL